METEDYKELQQLLEGSTESQNIDFKASSAWNVNSLAVDILAMSNVRDGGRIIIGVEEKPEFKPTGVSEEHLNTYKFDEMRDQMMAYADPQVIFTLSFPKDSQGNTYVIIKVLPFRSSPVICSKNNCNARTKEGVIYYRNSNRRPESAAVSNAYDMREILDTATVRLMQKYREMGLQAEQSESDADKLERQLGDL